MTEAQSIAMAAVRLPEGERVQVIEALLESLEPHGDDDPVRVAEAWREELSRRSQELRAGAVQPVAWSEVRAEGERLLDGSKSR